MKWARKNVIPIIVLVISLVLSCFFIYRIEIQKLNLNRERTHYVTNAQVSKLQYTMDSLFLKTQILEMLVIEENGEVKNFDILCKKLLDNPAIRSLQLAPNGVVTFVYPLKGNEQAFGDLFSDPDRKAEAEYARDTGRMTLAGPYELEQGGLGAVARQPIYLQDENGDSVFWGFSIIILDFPEALSYAELEQFAQEGFAYKLYRTDITTKKKQIIEESSDKPLSHPINNSFEVPNGEWTFSVMPKDGWVSIPSVILEGVIALLISVLFFFLAIAIFRIEMQRKKMSDLSMHDGLTGIYNQRMLIQILNTLIDKQTPFLLFYLDFDGFKNINDTYGHDCGDLFLIESAKRLRELFEKADSICRIGGDEFAIVIEQSLSVENSKQIIKTMEDAFAKPLHIAKNIITASVSIGVAHFPQDAKTLDQMIHIADQSMYQTKKQHKLMR
ncbi:MAG: diguanylate cyclase [Lachnospiraceae bacterium]